MTERRRAELIIEGRVATLAGDNGFGWAEALAVADGVVLHAGTASEVESMADRSTVRWRLGDEELVMPGITDAHLHLMALVRAERQVDLTDAEDLDATLAMLAGAHARMSGAGDAQGWLLGHGWSLDRLRRWPDVDLLERSCPGRPVALYAHDHHSRWLSETALRLAGITARSPDPEGGMIRRDAAGVPTGVLHEKAASLVDQAIPDPTDDELDAALGRQAAGLAALGLTGCHDPGELGADVELNHGPLFYRRLALAGGLPLRVHSSVRAPQLDRAIELGLVSGHGVAAEADDPAARRMAARYRMGWLKLFSDGSLGSRSAALLEPYSDAGKRPPTGGDRGMFLASTEELAGLVRRAAAAGISSQIHAIGDAAVRRALDVLEDSPRRSLIPRIEHAQLVHPADQARFGRLGVAASVQPVHLRSDALAVREAWGDRGDHAFPLGAIEAEGALIPIGTDAPVEPADPWPGLAVALARRDPFRPDDEPVGPAHAIDLARALRAACLDPALVAGEQQLGRLVAGSAADLIIVPAQGLREPVDPTLLAAARPLATLIDGELVYRAPDFDP